MSGLYRVGERCVSGLYRVGERCASSFHQGRGAGGGRRASTGFWSRARARSSPTASPAVGRWSNPLVKPAMTDGTFAGDRHGAAQRKAYPDRHGAPLPPPGGCSGPTAGWSLAGLDLTSGFDRWGACRWSGTCWTTRSWLGGWSRSRGWRTRRRRRPLPTQKDKCHGSIFHKTIRFPSDKHRASKCHEMIRNCPPAVLPLRPFVSVPVLLWQFCDTFLRQEGNLPSEEDWARCAPVRGGSRGGGALQGQGQGQGEGEGQGAGRGGGSRVEQAARSHRAHDGSALGAPFYRDPWSHRDHSASGHSAAAALRLLLHPHGALGHLGIGRPVRVKECASLQDSLKRVGFGEGEGMHLSLRFS